MMLGRCWEGESTAFSSSERELRKVKGSGERVREDGSGAWEGKHVQPSPAAPISAMNEGVSF